MEVTEWKAVVEGLIFASGDDGITVKQLKNILNITDEMIAHLIEELKYDYERIDRGIMMMESKGVLHLTTKPEHSEFYKKLLETPNSNRMSQAALETLAIIAYRQPITKAEIEELRGVKSDRPLQSLVAKSLIEEIGRKDSVGRPILYGTSKDFLTYFGLTSLEELPSLPDEVSDSSEVNQEADLFFEHFNEELNKNE
ncbi:SMC-Scp complex subunit ScpB [Oceanobacillus caeni]|uniref:Segregation and condensation protein B n=1 Tax=Oceanobacillus caeni TaxID=405946 RepID=A0ABR5MI11_9BACI|nr:MULTISPECIES: SMC-Scp complex subunit ScpB [Bacillaceae]KKE79307.1 segregation and condensation protein B [Bacilli bacterium VT-13-104]PZD83590.1 SMC-Scp complex subunit ScpB [Bacilli bacterium]KPH73827.1 segregation and condensation protein B [Oceanobacillus caeni]MBU8789766.1 SMC-Scp complex subunit ScpB [Oceanobacillus caeni]MCR1834380.1 SMC-Scp complex subunit ScpB [Oceanobacillus caeni]